MANAPHAPPRIRTDASNPFAHHTVAARVPAILQEVLERNPDYPADVRARVLELAQALANDAPLPPLDAGLPHAALWLPELALRRGQTWQGTDWFFAENYAYRQLADRTAFWTSARDPFAPHKRAEYASPTHARALESALQLAQVPEAGRIEALFGAAVFGNRIDLSFAASLERGVQMDADDLLVDARARAAALLIERGGPVHFVIDNAGSELSVDLVLADALLRSLDVPVVLHLKVHPAFVSDALADDVTWFLGGSAVDALASSWGQAASELRARLRAALERGALTLAPHPYWNGPRSLWELPEDLTHSFAGAQLVILKGDAHYRRAVGDAVWPPETPFADVTRYFPAPLLGLRTLKSDPIVDLRPGQAAALDASDPTWRVNGKRGVASLGGQRCSAGW